MNSYKRPSFLKLLNLSNVVRVSSHSTRIASLLPITLLPLLLNFSLSSCQTPWSLHRSPQSSDVDSPWPTHSAKPLELVYERAWTWTPGRAEKVLRIENLAFKKFRLLLQQEENSFPEEESNPYLELSIECTKPITIDEGHAFAKPTQRTQARGIRWYVKDKNAQRLQLIFSPESNRCELKITHPWRSWPEERWRVESLSQRHPLIQQLTYQPDCTTLPEDEHPIWSADAYLLSCPSYISQISDVEFLRDPMAAFNARFEALMGYRLPVEKIQEKDAEMPLDFSKAPRLQVIWLSSLNFTADFWGQILARILAYHAKQGSEIRILLAQPTLFSKDRQLLDHWLSPYPHVHIYPFKFRYFGQDNPGTLLDRIHRVNHMKILAATGYLHSGEPYGFVVTGGRNIRDSYLFRRKPDHSRFPWLINYARGESPFIFYDDFDVKITSAPLSYHILSQLWKLFYHGPHYQRAPSFQASSPAKSHSASGPSPSQAPRKTPSGTWVRHLISVPYADNQALERWLASMIDQAKREIWITTPYFRPPPQVEKALFNATTRGVQIHILTRIELAGDDIPKIAEEVNKKTVNRYFQRFHVYEWTEPDSIMHAKLWLIDNQISIVSSINLNHRSFLHDLESAMIFEGEEFAKIFQPQIQKFFENARKIVSPKDVNPLAQWVLQILREYF
ncbi:MAG: phosphatidylserine/phosphatidylglycerophosphate/cardiolipin synthase family protein [Bdellovibrionaceae bacterium]|nr:phosphatidylserine/phosphatidylglycerophosphate/cardiolipin synthase family protein [Pseudobdellovibrionaceae bacterium]